MASYLVPAAPARAELREKGSRFLALLEPVADEAAGRARLQAIEAEHRDATHCCWAWRLGAPPRERSDDAGEPRGTAGPPILRSLQAAELSDALLVVVRWFGGTKLGKGGLVRAYGAVAREAAAAAAVVRRLQRVTVTLELPYAHVGAVQRLLRPPEVELVEESFGERVRLVLAVGEERLAAVRELAAALGLTIREAPSLREG
ncbi:MAG TPA: YigZ family protein [Thermoanaerobaculia bacterium]|nr:YigZ family protein [Thermoanaerobaculia bacterium]